MGKNTIKATIPCDISDGDIDDIIDTAFSGGISYWCDEARLSEFAPKNGDYLSRYDNMYLHEENGKWYAIDKEKLLNGLSKCIEEQFETMLDYGALVLDERGSRMFIDSGGIDAMLSDCIIQYALFGDIVYG